MTFEKIVAASEALNEALREEGNIHGIALRLDLETFRLMDVEMINLPSIKAETLPLDELTAALEIWAGDDIVPMELQNLLTQVVEMLDNPEPVEPPPVRELTFHEKMEEAANGTFVSDGHRTYEKGPYGLWYLVYGSGARGTTGYAPARFPEEEFKFSGGKL